MSAALASIERIDVRSSVSIARAIARSPVRTTAEDAKRRTYASSSSVCVAASPRSSKHSAAIASSKGVVKASLTAAVLVTP
jgi:hypothetical protein